MRFAELVREDMVLETVTRIAKRGGFENFGATELANFCGFNPFVDFAKRIGEDADKHVLMCKTPGECGAPYYHERDT